MPGNDGRPPRGRGPNGRHGTSAENLTTGSRAGSRSGNGHDVPPSVASPHAMHGGDVGNVTPRTLMNGFGLLGDSSLEIDTFFLDVTGSKTPRTEGAAADSFVETRAANMRPARR